MNDLMFAEAPPVCDGYVAGVCAVDSFLVPLATTSRALSYARIADIGKVVTANVLAAFRTLGQDAMAIHRTQAVSHPRCLHPRSHGATLFGVGAECRVSADWAAWANTLSVSAPPPEAGKNQLPYFHDGLLVPVLIAAAQQTGANGDDLVQGIAVAMAAMRTLQKFRTADSLLVSHRLNAAQAMAAGLGRCLKLSANQVAALLQYVRMTKAISHLEIADIAQQVMVLTDRCLREEPPETPMIDKPAGEMAPLNSRAALLKPDLGDEVFALNAGQWLSRSQWALFLDRVQHLPCLTHAEIMLINPAADLAKPAGATPDGRGIF